MLMARVFAFFLVCRWSLLGANSVETRSADWQECGPDEELNSGHDCVLADSPQLSLLQVSMETQMNIPHPAPQANALAPVPAVAAEKATILNTLEKPGGKGGRSRGADGKKGHKAKPKPLPGTILWQTETRFSFHQKLNLVIFLVSLLAISATYMQPWDCEHAYAKQPEGTGKTAVRTSFFGNVPIPPEEHHLEDIEHRNCQDGFDEDIYGLAIISLVRDLHVSLTVNAGHSARLSRERDVQTLRASRSIMSVLMVLLNVGMQVFLLYSVRMYVTEDAVQKIQKAYDSYELHMYGNNLSHVTLTYGGSPRGVYEYFEPDNFKTVEEGMKKIVCAIPLSQPWFFMVILLIWTLTCMSQIKASVEMVARLIVNLPVVDSMADAVEIHEDDPQQVTIRGLTRIMKCVIVIVILIPRVLTTFFLLWLGCRWLAATTNFGDTIQNAVALEFILLIKDMIYSTVVPDRSKRELQNTSIATPFKSESASYMSLLGTFLWGVQSCLWCYWYIFCFQAVLPEYNWDVRDLCHPYLAEIHAKMPTIER